MAIHPDPLVIVPPEEPAKIARNRRYLVMVDGPTGGDPVAGIYVFSASPGGAVEQAKEFLSKCTFEAWPR